ncbi:thiamine phosphate synthase [Maribacter sp. 2304DJ31-5]|uniref:thiamine phosphate synthase n=1 Tax=Maribacter sp. 2304DJ31-5 TaxID=3386273 RepID=UPI0039BC2256
MLIVLTSERNLKNEATLLNQLFKNGLEVLHLRKPGFNAEAYSTLLSDIDSSYYKRIVIHEHHELCNTFKLKGIHIQEQYRLELSADLEAYVQEFQDQKYLVSSSFHEPEILNACSTDFDYHFLSPVFSSISKQGYKGRGFDVNSSLKKIIGMGGINSENITKTIALGYQGIGVLGGIWNTDKYLDSFLNIKNAYTSEISKR